MTELSRETIFEPFTQQSYKIISFNVANAINDEKVEEYRFGKRFHKIIDFIKNENADIVLLQELRKCKSHHGEIEMTSLDIAYEFAKGTNLEIAKLIFIESI